MMVLLEVLDKEESMVWFSDCFQFLQFRALLFVSYIFDNISKFYYFHKS